MVDISLSVFYNLKADVYICINMKSLFKILINLVIVMDNNGKLKIGMIGLGARGAGLLREAIMGRSDVEIAIVCDTYQDRVDDAINEIEKVNGNRPIGTLNYQDVINADIDAVVIAAAWECHVDLTIAAMERGIPVGCEVGGAYTVDDCWRLVHAYERTKTPVMMLENCCYNRDELMALRMVREGLFGEVVHCEGGYRHDLRDEITDGIENRHYRLRNYMNRNCENYPTHELGPIAKILNINRGNRMLSLTSTASSAKGLNAYVREKKGEGHELANYPFAQGDVVTTVIRCAQGQTITLTLDTTLPRWYSRSFQLQGTKGIMQEENRSIKLDGQEIPYAWNNYDAYYERYDHPVWKQYIEDGLHGGHGGMDGLLFNAFFAAVREKRPMPIDVYDMVAWMVITPLSEESISCGSMPVAIPDFTSGKWIMREQEEAWKYALI